NVFFGDIYPRRRTPITGAPEPNQVADSALDFDLNDAIVTEGSAQISFLSGALMGNNFTIEKYDHGTKIITFKQDEVSGWPNDTVKPATGDRYTLIGIEMPASYISAAEAEVTARID